MNSVVKDIIGRERKIISYASPKDSLLRRIIINSIELSTGRNKVEKAYEKLRGLGIQDSTIWDHVFPLLNIDLSFNEEALLKINPNVPVIVIANHPFGVADGLALGFVLSRIRKDFLLIVNEVLCREKILGKFFLPIDFREGREALQINLNTRKEALNHLSSGGSIGIFPSGGVSTTPNIWKRKALDLEWKNFVVKIVQQSNVHVLPIFFDGQNSIRFQLASHIHSNLRLALLLSELNKKRGSILRFRIGDPISPEIIRSLPRNGILNYLKERTFELQYEMI